MTSPSPYADSGVDTNAGDRAVDLMKKAVTASHSSRVIGGLGGFAGLYDASFLLSYRHPVLATSTDGVGTKVAIAAAIDKHDTIGFDLVGMVVDDIVVVGATPLFMTDYIACGRVVPERIAAIVEGIAQASTECGVSLVGGETAEHPGLLGENEYDLAGAATGVVEASAMLSAESVTHGDIVLALGSSGLHSNGYSLVRKIVEDNAWSYRELRPEFSQELGLELLQPTRLYTSALVDTLAAFPAAIHTLSHVTGGGIAQNLSRVLLTTVGVTLERSGWSPPAVMRVLAAAGGYKLEAVEETWNMGIGMLAVVDATQADAIAARLKLHGHTVWPVGVIQNAADVAAHAPTTSAKGVIGGAVALVGKYRD
ncbi:MAG: phosphoribosylformylglycinamidine cyclo-ligase [Pontimonas sp.]